VWITLRESKASFAIDGEADQADRIQRFANVLAQRTCEGELPLSDPALGDLQREILGGLTTLQQFGLRQSPVFVGEVVRFQKVVHYVAPPADELSRMLNGMIVFWQRTVGQPAVMRSAVLAFGFVYIHPLAGYGFSPTDGCVSRALWVYGVTNHLARRHSFQFPVQW
jgi:Fic family protein